MVAPDYLITAQHPGSSRRAARPPAGPAQPADFRCSCAFSSDLLAHPGLAHLRRQDQATLGLLPLRCLVCLVLANGGDHACPVLYRVESQSTVSSSIQRVVFHTLALVESIDIDSFAESGQPQAMPPVFGVCPSRRHLCRKAVVISTIH